MLLFTSLPPPAQARLCVACCLWCTVFSSAVCVLICSVRFVSKADNEWFEKCIKRVINEEVGEEFVPNVETTHYFQDFMR